MVRSSLTRFFLLASSIYVILCAVLRAQFDQSVELHFNHSGGYYQEATPVPISNTVVKLFGVDNTCLVTGREDRSLPDLYSSIAQLVEHAAVNRRVVSSSLT